MNNMAEGVGKKIVDALKQQSDIEIQNIVENPVEDTNFETIEYNNEEDSSVEYNQTSDNENTEVFKFDNPESLNDSVDDFELPNNVAVLKQLINQLPAGVSKQTGAQIIKQTMEALGISMKNVLQEAQQVQENINNTTREYQTSIVEHKKQISSLEKQTLKLQKQYANINDVISLFVQTSF